MKVEKAYSYTNNLQIWRLLITQTDKLIIETRNKESKEVFFSCLNIFTGEPVFEDIQFDEKSWIGIENTYKDIIYFHKYAKPDMPEHRQIIAFDINKQKVIWQKEEYSYYFVDNDKVYSIIDTFNGRQLYALNYLTGELEEKLGDDMQLIKKLRDTAAGKIDFSNYKFSEKIYNTDEYYINIKKSIEQYLKNIKTVGQIEFLQYDNFFFYSYHVKTQDNLMKNKFVILDKSNNREIFSSIINDKIRLYATDSFFTYKTLLLLLKNKKQLDVHNLIEV